MLIKLTCSRQVVRSLQLESICIYASLACMCGNFPKLTAQQKKNKGGSRQALLVLKEKLLFFSDCAESVTRPGKLLNFVVISLPHRQSETGILEAIIMNRY